MDEFDRASESEQRDRDTATKQRRATLVSTGYCHYCSEAIKAGRIFCNVDCRDDWEAQDAARRRNGE